MTQAAPWRAAVSISGKWKPHTDAAAIVKNPDMIWDTARQNTLTFLNHMNNVDLVKRTTTDWKDVYFLEIGTEQGS